MAVEIGGCDPYIRAISVTAAAKFNESRGITENGSVASNTVDSTPSSYSFVMPLQHW